MKVKKMRKLTSWQFIAIGYLAVIMMGCFLLTLPLSARSGEWTPVLDSLFTAVSATCVTGLSLFDTYVHWSGFGQVVILLLIQVGGIGFMTIITLFALLIKRQIGIYERRILVQSSGSVRTTGIITLIRRILIWTAIFESAGAAALAIRFCGDFGFWKGIYYAIFHSVSAFCNAGFDIMGVLGEGVSLMPYATDPLVCITVSVLIILGGLGFIVWSDLYDNRFKIKKCSLHTKIVIVVTAVLVAVGTGLFYLLEHNGVLSGLNGGQALLV
ncbi:MAG: Trk family potassium uptake protein, partial [Clostridiales bacterium]|nr:Trk family potassium uptake protein [Clostridiales bacterium]